MPLRLLAVIAVGHGEVFPVKWAQEGELLLRERSSFYKWIECA
jgi:hypothetical protein